MVPGPTSGDFSPGDERLRPKNGQGFVSLLPFKLDLNLDLVIAHKGQRPPHLRPRRGREAVGLTFEVERSLKKHPSLSAQSDANQYSVGAVAAGIHRVKELKLWFLGKPDVKAETPWRKERQTVVHFEAKSVLDVQCRASMHASKLLG